MDFIDYLSHAWLSTFLELVAAIMGSYYLRKVTHVRKIDKYFVVFLWVTFFVEIVGAYAPIAYFSDYELFAFILDTPFEKNFWLFNLYLIGAYSFYTYYFSKYLENKVLKKIAIVIVGVFISVCILNLFLSDIFFTGYAKLTTITGSLLIFMSIIAFFFDLLKSELLLKLKYLLPAYVAVGILLFCLCNTPFDIFSEYFKKENDFFVDLSAKLLFYTNVFMYSVFILGFLICLRKKKSY